MIASAGVVWNDTGLGFIHVVNPGVRVMSYIPTSFPLQNTSHEWSSSEHAYH
jgi:hypothetical protein